jgi:hypothetical protein
MRTVKDENRLQLEDGSHRRAFASRAIASSSLKLNAARFHRSAASSKLTSHDKRLLSVPPEPFGESTRAVTSNLGGCCPSSHALDSTSSGSRDENFEFAGNFRRCDANRKQASKAPCCVGPRAFVSSWPTTATLTTATSARVTPARIFRCDRRCTAKDSVKFLLAPSDSDSAVTLRSRHPQACLFPCARVSR